MRSSSTADVKEAANGNEDKCSKEVDCGAACDLHHCDFVFGHYCEVVKCACCYFKYVSNDICGGFDASVYSAASKRVCLVKAERLVFLMYVRFLFRAPFCFVVRLIEAHHSGELYNHHCTSADGVIIRRISHFS